MYSLHQRIVLWFHTDLLGHQWRFISTGIRCECGREFTR